MLKLPNTISLLTFLNAAHTGSFAKTARALCITPAAVSQQIKQLEKHLDYALFERSKLGVELTQAGHQYLFFAEQAVEKLKQGQQSLSQLKSQEILTLHAFPSVASKWLMPRVLGAMENDPNLEIRVEASHSNVDFNLSSCDACISFGKQDESTLHHDLLFHDDVILVASPSLLTRAGLSDIPIEKVRLSKLLEQPMIHIDWGSDNRFLPGWQDWLNTAGFPDKKPNKGPHFNLSSMAIDAATQGKGLLLGQGILIQEELRSGRLLIVSQIKLTLTKAYYLIYPERTKDKPEAMTFIEQLKAEK